MVKPFLPNSPHAMQDEMRNARALGEAGRHTEAEALYAQRLAQDPKDALALQGMGLSAVREERTADAVHWFSRAIQVRPNDADAQLNLATALFEMGQPEQALPLFQKVRMQRPAERSARLAAWACEAVLQERSGQVIAAIATLQRATDLEPQSAQAWAQLGGLYSRHRQLQSALDCFQRALQIEPERREWIGNFGQLLQELRRFEDAALVFERLLQVWPGAPFVHGKVLFCKMLIGDWFRLKDLQDRVERGAAAGLRASEPFALQAHCLSPATLRVAARVFGEALHPAVDIQPQAPGSGKARLRIGYVSGEFRDQATSVLLTEVLERHDAQGFEVVAFDNGWDDGSSLRQRIRAAVSQIVPIAGQGASAVAARVRAMGIDVLINLNGYFGLERNDVFALRPAPVQVNYLGFPGTMGRGYMDYLIADHVVVPQGEDMHYSEAVVRLPDSYQPNDSRRLVSTEPLTRAEVGLPEDAFVFCNFNNSYKILPQVFDIWMRLLQQVPGSVLWLYGLVPEGEDNFKREAQQRGVDGQRLIFAPPWANHRHLARLALADLFVDTWPYNAHTTGSDALWAGLPVLTCTGPTFPSRVGASLARAVGMQEMVTQTLADYEALALQLAQQPALLGERRARLAAQRLSSPLYDAVRYTRHLEWAYRQMTQRARQGLPPMGFDVPGL